MSGSNRRARSSTPPRRRLDLTSLPYDPTLVSRAAAETQYFPDHEVREKMFSPRINSYRNLHRPKDIFESLNSAGAAKQERDRALASANSFRELNKLWDGFRTKTPSGDRPPFNVFASVNTLSQPPSRTSENRCPWKKKEEENEKRNAEFEAKKKRLARPATPPPLLPTESSLKKVQAKAPVINYRESSQIMPRRLSTPYTREQEKLLIRKETDLSVRRESIRKSVSIDEVVRRLASPRRPQIDAIGSKKAQPKQQSAASGGGGSSHRVAQPQVVAHRADSPVSSVVLDQTHTSFIELDDTPAKSTQQAAAPPPSAQHDAEHGFGTDSVSYEVEGSPNDSSPNAHGGDDPAGQQTSQASSSGATIEATKVTEQQHTGSDHQPTAGADQSTEAAPAATPSGTGAESIDDLFLENSVPTAVAPRRRFKELEVDEN
jgi:hypothetical protein